MEKDIAIVYMVAGLSSRFGGKIKQLIKIGPKNETLIEYSLNQAINAGITKIIFIVGEKTEQPFKELFKENYQGIPVYYALQTYNKKERDRPWGTLDALISAKNILNQPFIVCNGDDIYGEKTFEILVSHLKENSYGATIGYKLIDVIPEKGSVHRAIFETNENGNVKTLTEIFNINKSEVSNKNLGQDALCSMNIFALYPGTLNLLEKKLKDFKKQNKNSKTAEALLPNEISKLTEKNSIKLKLYLASDKWFGVTNPEDEEIVREVLRNQFQTNL